MNVRPLLWLPVLVLLLVPTHASALSLHWASGVDSIRFTQSRRCTLVVEPSEATSMLPAEWKLVWVASGLADLAIIPDSSANDPARAQVTSVLQPTIAERSANQLTADFHSRGRAGITSAQYLLDLPAGASGKFIAIVPATGTAAATSAVLRSNVATFNGGIDGEFPSTILAATGDHRTTHFTLRAVGAGIGASTSARLVAPDTSWQVPLTITEVTDSTFAAEAELPVQLPDAILQVAPADQPMATTTLFASQVMAPLLAPITIRGNSFLVPPDSAGVIPKDFAFVFNTVPTATPGIWRNLFHLLYIRRLPDDETFTLGHAWSPDLQNWTSDHNAFGTGPFGTFDAGHVWAPSIVQNGNLSYMFYTAVDAGGNQRIGRVTTALLDTTNTVWSLSDRKLVYAADSTEWVARHPQADFFRDQFRDPFVFPHPDTAGRFLMVYTARDTNYKAQSGNSVGLAINQPGTLDRWKDNGRYGVTDFGRNGHIAQVESPHVIPDSGYVPPYSQSGSLPGGWRLLYTWGGTHPEQQTIRVVKDTLLVNVADTSSAGWGATRTLFGYLAGDTTVTGWNGTEHLKAGNVDYLAGYNAYVVDGIQIARMYWSGPDFSLRIPSVTGIDEVGSATANVRFGIDRFDPRAAAVRFAIDLPSALSVRLDLFDVAGRRVRRLLDCRLPAGSTIVRWDRRSAYDGAGVPSGVYFARLTYELGARVARIPLVR